MGNRLKCLALITFRQTEYITWDQPFLVKNWTGFFFSLIESRVSTQVLVFSNMIEEFCICRILLKHLCLYTQEANLVEEVEDSQDFWSGPVQSYNSPVEHRF